MGLYSIVMMIALFAQEPSSKVITNAELVSLLADPEIQLVDVRTPQEWEKGIIKGAKKVNFYDGDFLEQMNSLDKAKPLIVYCAVGGRSATATRKLLASGFKEVYDLGGGFNGWKKEGRPISDN